MARLLQLRGAPPCPCLPAPGSALPVQTNCSLALRCPFPPLERIVSYACPLVPSFASGGGPAFGLGWEEAQLGLGRARLVEV